MISPSRCLLRPRSCQDQQRLGKRIQRAFEAKFVVLCCGNELLRSTLSALYAKLEKCQKSLEGYLEQKRGKLPRFYFVSNPVLLLILRQGSDPLQMQPHYEKVFDSIARVHGKGDKNQIQIRFFKFSRQ